jgi:hypothetical protein
MEHWPHIRLAFHEPAPLCPCLAEHTDSFSRHGNNVLRHRRRRCIFTLPIAIRRIQQLVVFLLQPLLNGP